MMMLIELTGPRRRRLEVALDNDALPKMEEFLRGFASNRSWKHESTQRLVLVGEETLSNLLEEAKEGAESGEGEARRLVIIARPDGHGAELEFISASGGENLEDRLAYVGETPDIAEDREMSYRLLRHYASFVRHQKYHGVDIVTVNVEGAR